MDNKVEVQDGITLKFPKNFEWGTATAAFQIEGGVSERGRCIWDAFCDVSGNVDNGDDGKVACDHYHRYEEDVALMKQLGVKNYRFSLSWPRLFPKGRVEDGVNEKGRQFYDGLIDCLIRNGIKPGLLTQLIFLFSFSLFCSLSPLFFFRAKSNSISKPSHYIIGTYHFPSKTSSVGGSPLRSHPYSVNMPINALPCLVIESKHG